MMMLLLDLLIPPRDIRGPVMLVVVRVIVAGVLGVPAGLEERVRSPGVGVGQHGRAEVADLEEVKGAPPALQPLARRVDD
jgi:hypothetical protein